MKYQKPWKMLVMKYMSLEFHPFIRCKKEESSSAGIRRIKAVVTNGPVDIIVAGEA